MSVVAVKVNQNNIEIAADSILVKGDSKRTDTQFHKLVKVNDMIIGSVGSAEELSLFLLFCETHKISEAKEKCVLDFMCEFINWKSSMIEGCLIENDYIIIYNCKAYLVEHLFVKEIFNYEAIGAGEDFATAALYLGKSAKEAVKVACDLCCYVAEPIIEFKVSK